MINYNSPLKVSHSNSPMHSMDRVARDLLSTVIDLDATRDFELWFLHKYTRGRNQFGLGDK